MPVSLAPQNLASTNASSFACNPRIASPHSPLPNDAAADAKSLSPRDLARLPRNQFSRLTGRGQTTLTAPASLRAKGQRLQATTERAIRLIGPVIQRLSDVGQHEPERGVRPNELGNLNWLVKEVMASPVIDNDLRDQLLNAVVDVLEPFVAYLDKNNYGPLSPCEIGVLKLQQRLARITYVEELDDFRAKEIAATKAKAEAQARVPEELEGALANSSVSKGAEQGGNCASATEELDRTSASLAPAAAPSTTPLKAVTPPPSSATTPRPHLVA